MTHQGPWIPTRVAIIGASGLTGSGLASQLSQADLVEEVLLIDVRENVLRAHAIDLAEAQIVTGRTRTRITVVAPEDVPGAGTVDLVVLAASLPERAEGTRSAFLEGNLALVRNLAPMVALLAGESGLVMVLTNPADILSTCLSSYAGVAPSRVFGYSLNDSVRLAAATARELGIDPTRIHAEVFGEHGERQVPLFSRLTVDGLPVALGDEQRARITADIAGWFQRWSDLEPGRSSGWTTPVGALETIRRLGSGVPVPAAVWSGGEITGSAGHVSLLATLDTDGVRAVEVALPDDELLLLRDAARALRATVDDVLSRTTAPD